MKRLLRHVMCLCVTLSSSVAMAQATCSATFLQNTGDFTKGAKATVYDYYYKQEVLLLGVTGGYFDAKHLKLDKGCTLEKLERRYDLETVR